MWNSLKKKFKNSKVVFLKTKKKIENQNLWKKKKKKEEE